MLRPTLYIPSQLAKLLIPITLQQRALLETFADLFRPANGHGRCRALQ